MEWSLDFIWDPEKDKFNLEFFEVEEYDMNKVIELYRQMMKFIVYRDLLYSKAVNNKVNIRSIIKHLKNRTDIKFMKRVITSLVNLGYVVRENVNVLLLNSNQYIFEKEYIVPKMESFVLDFSKNIGNLVIYHDSKTSEFKNILDRYLAMMKRILILIKYLQQGICKIKEPICPFIDSLGVVAAGHLLSYTTIKPNSFYTEMSGTGDIFSNFYRTMKDIIFNPELDNYKTIVIVLGPGSEINEYLPDYALQAEEYDNENVLIIPVETGKKSFGSLSRKQILKGYQNKRNKLFRNSVSPGRLFVADDINTNFGIVSDLTNNNIYYGTATICLVKEGFNPAMSGKNVILQCGISAVACSDIFNKALNYHLKIDIYISVRGSVNKMYMILDKNGGIKHNNIIGEKLADWTELKRYLYYKN